MRRVGETALLRRAGLCGSRTSSWHLGTLGQTVLDFRPSMALPGASLRWVDPVGLVIEYFACSERRGVHLWKGAELFWHFLTALYALNVYRAFRDRRL